ncbi:MAG: cyanoexosortase C [Leptolyngbyaceae cyanobacterium]
MEHNRHTDSKRLSSLLRSVRTPHGFMVSCGLLIGFFYFPTWFGYLFKRALAGAVSWFLIAAMLLFISIDLYQKRTVLQKYVAPEEDKIIGYALIISGVLAYPFCRFAIWPQALLWLVIMLGIIISTWGLGFFTQNKLSTIFLCFTVYPRLGILSRAAWEFFVPPYALENLMAQGASFALKNIGFQVSTDGRFMVFPQGMVEVGWGCNGLDMAITIAFAGLFLGLIFRQTVASVTQFIAIGILISLIANIPRLMLVSIAYVYWGKGWFNFWHGFWGGQVFSACLFTLYYYLVVFLTKPAKTSA